MTDEICYSANPVVSCREEGDDGALLYNPDTDEALLINPTGKIIWEFIATPHIFKEIEGHLAGIAGTASKDQIAKDLVQFLKELIPDFVSEVIPSESGCK